MTQRVLDKLHISTDHRVVAAALDRMPSKAIRKDSRETSSSGCYPPRPG